MHSILIIEDDLSLGKTLKNLLSNKQCKTTVCRSVDQSYQYLETNNPELVIADRLLPDGDGIEIVDFLKNYSYRTKVLMLSKKCDVENRIEGFKNGADDYLAKPFSSQELKLRIDSLLNKNKFSKNNSIRSGDIEFFPKDGKIVVGLNVTKLRKKESDLFHCLISHQNQVVSRQQIIDWVWGCSDEIPTRSAIDVYIKRIRDKVGINKINIKTIRGFGYMFKPKIVKN